jgi:hypothetical protein
MVVTLTLPPANRTSLDQGWKKPGFLLKKNQPSGIFWFFWDFWVFLGFFGFFLVFCPTRLNSNEFDKRGFLGFFQFQNTFR